MQLWAGGTDYKAGAFRDSLTSPLWDSDSGTTPFLMNKTQIHNVLPKIFMLDHSLDATWQPIINSPMSEQPCLLHQWEFLRMVDNLIAFKLLLWSFKLYYLFLDHLLIWKDDFYFIFACVTILHLIFKKSLYCTRPSRKAQVYKWGIIWLKQNLHFPTDCKSVHNYFKCILPSEKKSQSSSSEQWVF